ncbi:MAG TPA: DUF5915 domain-containing protein, partial [Candidatus Polarisedimenticolaceae bacterium]|nr:DUF5915 domain-containing protein [Candidatus Polarisedimenticolaceae bacterium]
SNWYVRRSRRRFWKSEDDTDKAAAYATLHYVLVRVSQLLAPWSPFVSDKLWRELTVGMDVPPSVHVSDWPTSSLSKDESQLITDMHAARMVVTDSLSKRAEAGIKVRQPLLALTVPLDLSPELRGIIAEEVNVKQVVKGKELSLDIEISKELEREGAMRDIVRQVQSLRKKTGLDVDDRITLSFSTEDGALQKAVDEHEVTIAAETLALKVHKHWDGEALEGEGSDSVKINGAVLGLKVEKLAS